MKFFLLATIMSLALARTGISQTWQMTGSGSNDWISVAASANGQDLIAGQWPGAFAISPDAGMTWTNVMTNGYWNSVACSADGATLLAAASYVDNAHISGIFLSTNSGVSWISNSFPVLYWGSVAVSADGGSMIAVAPFTVNDSGSVSGAIFVSTNSGVNWVSNNIAVPSNVSSATAVSVAMSADGRKIFVTGPLEICYSTNAGTSWLQMTSAPPVFGIWSPAQTIACSADGNKLIFGVVSYVSGTGVYISTNSGGTWNKTILPQASWDFVASSADGQTLMAASGLSPEFNQPEAPLFISTNSGASWTTNASENWAAIACSADGSAMFAVAASDTNLDSNSGAIFKSQSIVSPALNVVPAGGEILLSWLIPSTDFVLQQSPDLVNWTAVTNTPVPNLPELEEQTLLPTANPAGFYRLVTPKN